MEALKILTIGFLWKEIYWDKDRGWVGGLEKTLPLHVLERGTVRVEWGS